MWIALIILILGVAYWIWYHFLSVDLTELPDDPAEMFHTIPQHPRIARFVIGLMLAIVIVLMLILLLF